MTNIARSGLRSAFTPFATIRRASMSRPESVSSKMASLGSRIAIWRISLRFFSPPENPSLTDRLMKLRSISTSFIFSLAKLEEVHRVELVEPALAAQRVERGAQEVEVPDAGDLDGVLERQEDPGGGAVLGRHREQVLPLEEDLAGDVVGLVAGEHVGEGALAGPVRPHERVHLARFELEADAPEDLVVADAWRGGPSMASISRRFLPGSRSAASGPRRRTPWAAP